jgi:hypothetical protein
MYQQGALDPLILRKHANLFDSTKANELCVTELLTDIQDSVGTLSVGNIVQIVTNLVSGGSNIPQNVTCSDCVKESLNIINKDYPGLIPNSTSSLSSTCGSNFTGKLLVCILSLLVLIFLLQMGRPRPTSRSPQVQPLQAPPHRLVV